MIDYEYQRVAIARPDGGVSIMSIIVKAPLSAFSPDAALANGFIIGVDPASGEEFWDGGITDEGVNAEIQRAGVHGLSWRRISEEEVPKDRTVRDALKPDLTIDEEKAAALRRERAIREEMALERVAARDAARAAAAEKVDQRLAAETITPENPRR